MIRPQPCGSIEFVSALFTKNTARRLTFSTRSQSATGMSSSSDWVKMPALLTRMSTGPRPACTCSAMAAVAVSSLTSQRTNSPRRPAASISARTPAACSGPAWSTTATSAPSRANAAAMPCPIPDAAPVTTATCPQASPCRSFLLDTVPGARVPVSRADHTPAISAAVAISNRCRMSSSDASCCARSSLPTQSSAMIT